ncbi:MucR family transcriptional regulator [Novosphingobium fluoreni]|uniref:MucR family transcriptional regulator n=1 Tax=Novosphingobium fluoreni TaxID=1391222 RepID=UPI003DA15CE0
MPVTGAVLTAEPDLTAITATIVAAYVSRNETPIDDLPGVIRDVHSALAGLGAPLPVVEAKPEPAVSIGASVKPDHIICLDCGLKQKMLKRHLQSAHGLTPEDYRARWNLLPNYPFVAPNYAAKRRDLALSIGLGRKPGGEG